MEMGNSDMDFINRICSTDECTVIGLPKIPIFAFKGGHSMEHSLTIDWAQNINFKDLPSPVEPQTTSAATKKDLSPKLRIVYNVLETGVEIVKYLERMVMTHRLRDPVQKMIGNGIDYTMVLTKKLVSLLLLLIERGGQTIVDKWEAKRKTMENNTYKKIDRLISIKKKKYTPFQRYAHKPIKKVSNKELPRVKSFKAETLSLKNLPTTFDDTLNPKIDLMPVPEKYLTSEDISKKIEPIMENSPDFLHSLCSFFKQVSGQGMGSETKKNKELCEDKLRKESEKAHQRAKEHEELLQKLIEKKKRLEKSLQNRIDKNAKHIQETSIPPYSENNTAESGSANRERLDALKSEAIFGKFPKSTVMKTTTYVLNSDQRNTEVADNNQRVKATQDVDKEKMTKILSTSSTKKEESYKAANTDVSLNEFYDEKETLTNVSPIGSCSILKYDSSLRAIQRIVGVTNKDEKNKMSPSKQIDPSSTKSEQNDVVKAIVEKDRPKLDNTIEELKNEAKIEVMTKLVPQKLVTEKSDFRLGECNIVKDNVKDPQGITKNDEILYMKRHVIPDVFISGYVRGAAVNVGMVPSRRKGIQSRVINYEDTTNIFNKLNEQLDSVPNISVIKDSKYTLFPSDLLNRAMPVDRTTINIEKQTQGNDMNRQNEGLEMFRETTHQQRMKYETTQKLSANHSYVRNTTTVEEPSKDTNTIIFDGSKIDLKKDEPVKNIAKLDQATKHGDRQEHESKTAESKVKSDTTNKGTMTPQRDDSLPLNTSKESASVLTEANLKKIEEITKFSDKIPRKTAEAGSRKITCISSGVPAKKSFAENTLKNAISKSRDLNNTLRLGNILSELPKLKTKVWKETPWIREEVTIPKCAEHEPSPKKHLAKITDAEQCTNNVDNRITIANRKTNELLDNSESNEMVENKKFSGHKVIQTVVPSKTIQSSEKVELAEDNKPQEVSFDHIAHSKEKHTDNSEMSKDIAEHSIEYHEVKSKLLMKSEKRQRRSLPSGKSIEVPVELPEEQSRGNSGLSSDIETITTSTNEVMNKNMNTRSDDDQVSHHKPDNKSNKKSVKGSRLFWWRNKQKIETKKERNEIDPINEIAIFQQKTIEFLKARQERESNILNTQPRNISRVDKQSAEINKTEDLELNNSELIEEIENKIDIDKSSDENSTNEIIAKKTELQKKTEVLKLDNCEIIGGSEHKIVTKEPSVKINISDNIKEKQSKLPEINEHQKLNNVQLMQDIEHKIDMNKLNDMITNNDIVDKKSNAQEITKVLKLNNSQIKEGSEHTFNTNEHSAKVNVPIDKIVEQLNPSQIKDLEMTNRQLIENSEPKIEVDNVLKLTNRQLIEGSQRKIDLNKPNIENDTAKDIAMYRQRIIAFLKTREERESRVFDRLLEQKLENTTCEVKARSKTDNRSGAREDMGKDDRNFFGKNEHIVNTNKSSIETNVKNDVASYQQRTIEFLKARQERESPISVRFSEQKYKSPSSDIKRDSETHNRSKYEEYIKMENRTFLERSENEVDPNNRIQVDPIDDISKIQHSTIDLLKTRHENKSAIGTQESNEILENSSANYERQLKDYERLETLKEILRDINSLDESSAPINVEELIEKAVINMRTSRETKHINTPSAKTTPDRIPNAGEAIDFNRTIPQNRNIEKIIEETIYFLKEREKAGLKIYNEKQKRELKADLESFAKKTIDFLVAREDKVRETAENRKPMDSLKFNTKDTPVGKLMSHMRRDILTKDDKQTDIENSAKSDKDKLAYIQYKSTLRTKGANALSLLRNLINAVEGIHKTDKKPDITQAEQKISATPDSKPAEPHKKNTPSTNVSQTAPPTSETELAHTLEMTSSATESATRKIEPKMQTSEPLPELLRSTSEKSPSVVEKRTEEIKPKIGTNIAISTSKTEVPEDFAKSTSGIIEPQLEETKTNVETNESLIAVSKSELTKDSVGVSPGIGESKKEKVKMVVKTNDTTAASAGTESMKDDLKPSTEIEKMEIRTDDGVTPSLISNTALESSSTVKDKMQSETDNIDLTKYKSHYDLTEDYLKMSFSMIDHQTGKVNVSDIEPPAKLELIKSSPRTTEHSLEEPNIGQTYDIIDISISELSKDTLELSFKVKESSQPANQMKDDTPSKLTKDKFTDSDLVPSTNKVEYESKDDTAASIDMELRNDKPEMPSETLTPKTEISPPKIDAKNDLSLRLIELEKALKENEEYSKNLRSLSNLYQQKFNGISNEFTMKKLLNAEELEELRRDDWEFGHEPVNVPDDSVKSPEEEMTLAKVDIFIPKDSSSSKKDGSGNRPLSSLALSNAVVHPSFERTRSRPFTFLTDPTSKPPNRRRMGRVESEKMKDKSATQVSSSAVSQKDVNTYRSTLYYDIEVKLAKERTL